MTETVKEAFSEYLEAKESSGADLAFLRRNLQAWKALEPVFGRLTLSELRPSLTEVFLHYRVSSGVAATTAARELACVRAALSWGKLEGRVPASCALRPAKVRLRTRDRWLSSEEAAKLLGAAKEGYLRAFILLALRTAGRSGAILSLTWDRVDFQAGTIDFQENLSGNRKGRAKVLMGPGLAEELTKLKATAKSDYVVERGGRRLWEIRDGVRAAASRAGLAGVTPHVLRHTAATHMVKAGVSIYDVARFLGHSSSRVTERVYAHHAPDFLKSAAQAVEKLGAAG